MVSREDEWMGVKCSERLWCNPAYKCTLELQKNLHSLSLKLSPLCLLSHYKFPSSSRKADLFASTLCRADVYGLRWNKVSLLRCIAIYDCRKIWKPLARNGNGVCNLHRRKTCFRVTNSLTIHFSHQTLLNF